MKRFLAAAGLVAGLLLVTAVPSFGHATLDKKQVQANEEVDLVLSVPSEIDGQRNVKVVLELPSGFAFRNCIATGNWACSLGVEPNPNRDAITWTPVPGNDQGIETFQFRVQARAANGNVPFEVNQFYSNGEVVNWDGEAGSDKPAPVVTVVGGTEPGPGDVNVKAAEEHADHGAEAGHDDETPQLESGDGHEADGVLETTASDGDGTTIDLEEVAEESSETNWLFVGLFVALLLGSTAVPVIDMLRTPSEAPALHH